MALWFRPLPLGRQPYLPGLPMVDQARPSGGRRGVRLWRPVYPVGSPTRITLQLWRDSRTVSKTGLSAPVLSLALIEICFSARRYAADGL